MTNDSRDWPRNRETRINLFSGRSRSVGTFRPPHMEPSSSRLREPRLSIGAGIRDLERRTAEVPNILRSNINNIIDELRPIVERARNNTDNIIMSNNDGNVNVSLASWLSTAHPPAITAPPREPNNSTTSNNDVVIDVETSPPIVPPIPVSTTSASNAPSPTQSTGTANNSNNGSGDEQDIADPQMLNVTNGVVVNTFCKYLPFFVLVLTKYFFDNVMGLAAFSMLLLAFYYLNVAVKKEVGRQTTRTIGSMIVFSFQMIGGVAFVIIVCYQKSDILIFSRSIFVSPLESPPTLSGLLWGVIVTDFVIKIVTVIIKGMFVLLPQKIIQISKRGKWFLFIEASSQLYRNVLPIQAWLHYLLQSYIGPQKVIGVFLSAAYMVSKANLVMASLKLWWLSLIKVLRNVTIGTTPTKEQIATAGNQCSICHDEFKTPVLLECQHIFCEVCVTKWLDREQTCPLCRAKIVDDPSWRDGSTTHFIQLF